MIVDLPDTTASMVSRTLVRLRADGGAVALGRVLTLIIVTHPGEEEAAVEAANAASREHPMRVLVVMIDDPDAEARLDAQVRVGADAGASEVVLLSAMGPAGTSAESLVNALLLPDAPVVAWWPGSTPPVPALSQIGGMAQRRITDAAAQSDPNGWARSLGDRYAAGDTDLAWTRLTHWREQLAAALDQPPYEPVLGARVRGARDSPSTLLLAAWLRLQLGVPVDWGYAPADRWRSGIRSVRLERASGDISLQRVSSDRALLSQPGQPQHELLFPRRTLRECLAEELRRLDADLLYGRVITDGLALLGPAAREVPDGARR
jgi:glucose-6-phosphate dehydrogenase assembly protein OpcA